MAVLTEQDAGKIWRSVYKGADKALFKGASEPISMDQLLSAFQAVEDRYNAQVAGMISDMITQAGVTLSSDQAFALARGWVRWKAEGN